MALPARLLNPGEEVVADIRPHWWSLALPVAAAVAALAGAVVAGVAGVPRPLAWLVVAVLILILGWLVVRYSRWNCTRLLVTSDRLVLRQGFFLRRVREIPLAHLRDIGYRQTIGQRLLNAGDLVVESAGRGSHEVFAWFPRPGAIQNLISRRIDGAGPGMAPSLAGELERLDDLRRRGVLTHGEFEAQKRRLLGR